MRRMLFIAGIAVFVLCVIAIGIAVFSRFGYYHLMDGSPEQYHGLHRRMVMFGAVGIISAAAGTIIFFIRSRM